MDKYQCLKLISCQVFSPNCQKITWGHHGRCLTPPHDGGHHRGHLTPCDDPMLFFSKNKNYLSIQMHTFFPITKTTWGGGHQTLPTLCLPSKTSLTSTPYTPPPIQFSGGSRISHRGGMHLLGGGMDLRCRHFLVKMYAKMKELGPIGGGVRPVRPLDPPMQLGADKMLLTYIRVWYLRKELSINCEQKCIYQFKQVKH